MSAMIKLLTAQEANWHAKQRTYLSGLLETIIYPKIQHDASFGKYETRILLEQYDFCTPETITHLTGILQKHGYSVKVKNKTLFVEWK
jgi:hypothetical protein